MVNRADVYAAIDTERNYQEQKGKELGWGAGQGASNHSIGDFLTLLRVYVGRADDAYANTVGDAEVLNVIRKIAGICVAGMERHGAPPRKV